MTSDRPTPDELAELRSERDAFRAKADEIGDVAPAEAARMEAQARAIERRLEALGLDEGT